MILYWLLEPLFDAGAAASMQILISFTYFIVGHFVTFRFPIFELMFHGWMLRSMFLLKLPPHYRTLGTVAAGHQQSLQGAQDRFFKVFAGIAYAIGAIISYR